MSPRSPSVGDLVPSTSSVAPHLTRPKELCRSHAADFVQSSSTVVPSQSFRRRLVVRVRSSIFPCSSFAALAQSSRQCCVVRNAINPLRLLHNPRLAHPMVLRCPGKRRLNSSEAFFQPLCSPFPRFLDDGGFQLSGSSLKSIPGPG